MPNRPNIGHKPNIVKGESRSKWGNEVLRFNHAEPPPIF